MVGSPIGGAAVARRPVPRGQLQDVTVDITRFRQDARTAGAAGDRETAVTAWRQLLNLKHDDFEAHESLGGHLHALGRLGEALPHVVAAAETAPGRTKGWIRLARLLEEAGDDEGAVSAWKRVVDLEPEDITSQDRLSSLLLGLGRDLEAVPHLKAIALVTPDTSLWSRIARICASAGDHGEAVEAWRQVIILGGESAELHDRLAQLLLGLGRKTEALPHLRAAAHRAPKVSKAWTRLANAAELSGDVAEAEDAWRHVLELDSSNGQAHKHLSQLLIRLHRLQEAVPHLRALADAEPHDLNLTRSLALNAEEAGQFEVSISAWRRVLWLDEGDIDAHLRLSQMLMGLGRFRQALPHLRAVAQGSPDDPKTWARLARAMEETGDADAAVEAWRRVLDLGVAVDEARERLSQQLCKLGRRSEATPLLLTLAESSPDEPKSWARVARNLEETEEIEEAIPAWERVLSLAPDDEEAHERLAKLADRTGRADKALAHYQALARANPASSKSWSRVARALQQTGDPESEAAAWRRVLAAGEDVEARRRLAELLFASGELEEASACLSALADPGSRLAALWIRLARRLETEGEKDRAATARLRVQALQGGASAGADPGKPRRTGGARSATALAHYALAGLCTLRDIEFFLRADEELKRIADVLTCLEASRRQDGADDPTLDQDAFGLLLDRLASIVATNNLSEPDTVAELWRTLSTICEDSRFVALAKRFPDELARFVQSCGGVSSDMNPFVDGFVGLLVQSDVNAAPLGSRLRTMLEDAAEVDAIADRLMSDKAFWTPVLICGFHHSGTRLLARMMARAGVFQRATTSSYEWKYIQTLNTVISPGWADADRIAAGQVDGAPRPISPEWLAFRLAAAGYAGGRPWGHKDPRSSVTADDWLATFPRLRIVNIVRNPLDAVGALPERYAQFTPDGRRPQDASEWWGKLWRIYLDRIRSSMERATLACEVRFEDLCLDPKETLTRVLAELDLDLEATAEHIQDARIDQSKIGDYRSWAETGRLDAQSVRRLGRLARQAGYAAD